jgi:hypothetical protein
MFQHYHSGEVRRSLHANLRAWTSYEVSGANTEGGSELYLNYSLYGFSTFENVLVLRVE